MEKDKRPVGKGKVALSAAGVVLLLVIACSFLFGGKGSKSTDGDFSSDGEAERAAMKAALSGIRFGEHDSGNGQRTSPKMVDTSARIDGRPEKRGSGDELFGVRLGERGRNIKNLENVEPLKHDGETVYFFKPKDTSWGFSTYIAKVDQNGRVFHICGMKSCETKSEGLRVLGNARRKLERSFGQKMERVDKGAGSEVYAITLDDKEGVLERGVLARCDTGSKKDKYIVSVELFDVKQGLMQKLLAGQKGKSGVSELEYRRLKSWYAQQLDYNGVQEVYFQAEKTFVVLQLYGDSGERYEIQWSCNEQDEFLEWPRSMPKGFAKELIEARIKILSFEQPDWRIHGCRYLNGEKLSE